MTRSFLNCAIALCLLTLAGVNLASNPFLPNSFAQEVPCEGEPPSPECECCTDCGCWFCP